MRRSIFDTGNRELPTSDHPLPKPSSSPLETFDNKLLQQLDNINDRLLAIEKAIKRL